MLKIVNVSKASTRLYSTEKFTRPLLKIPRCVRGQHDDQDREGEVEMSEASTELCHLIGNREIVGYGMNGQPSYVDSRVFPFPSLRWKECTPEIMALREKEKGDWKGLTEADKKALYRASFRQTFAEMNAPTGQWKSIVGSALILISLGIWAYIFIHVFVHNPIPHTFNPEAQEHQLKRMLDLKVNPIHGLSSKWDYENSKWK